MSWKYINKIGLEIEANWHKERNDLVEDAGIKAELFKKPVSWGELVSKPMDDEEKIIQYLKDNWPDETHHMAGFHIHLSFKSIAMYVALMNKKFNKHFLECMNKFGESYPIQNPEFWDRLEDKNKFCRQRFAPEDQIFLKKKINNDPGRYTQLHYAYGLHGTIESRLLPTFITVECAIAGLKAHIDCFESYLDQNPPSDFNFKKEFILEDDSEVETDLAKIFDMPEKLVKSAPFNLFMAQGKVNYSDEFGPNSLNKKVKKTGDLYVGKKAYIHKPIDINNLNDMNKDEEYHPPFEPLEMPEPTKPKKAGGYWAD